MKIFKTNKGVVIETRFRHYLASDLDWNQIFRQTHPASFLQNQLRKVRVIDQSFLQNLTELLPPILDQETWAAGVTYYRSRTARMEESKTGGNFYDLVYEAKRPELFFKATPNRVVGDGQKVRIRRDSRWNVPEPELTLAISSHGKIFGYTIGNDMSSRDIEGENPLYLPQAKVYNQSAALGPCVLISDQPLASETEIRIEIFRHQLSVFQDSTKISKIKRSFEEIVEFLFRDNSFPVGCFLMTGTGIVPPDSFTLQSGDRIEITIQPIGTLCNIVS